MGGNKYKQTLADFVYSWLLFFRYNSSLTNSTQLGNDSNYSKFNGIKHQIDFQILTHPVTEPNNRHLGCLQLVSSDVRLQRQPIWNSYDLMQYLQNVEM